MACIPLIAYVSLVSLVLLVLLILLSEGQPRTNRGIGREEPDSRSGTTKVRRHTNRHRFSGRLVRRWNVGCIRYRAIRRIAGGISGAK
ncbi:hypothetical protein F5B20DRAFT_559190 [Whalleya microplaca]|nr:hypothetical protein F5B20DRAFT_559190 [Whalleya microplaca]